ncbi:transposase [Streptomyces sp. NPDC059218]|uniref:transposase n=1 Tax=unclassified Streptomyces TaxID=2593676 RepID=UPI0036A04649
MGVVPAGGAADGGEASAGRGRRRAGDRGPLAAVTFVATSGCMWRQLPPVLGPASKTVCRCFAQWSADRIRARLHRGVRTCRASDIAPGRRRHGADGRTWFLVLPRPTGLRPGALRPHPDWMPLPRRGGRGKEVAVHRSVRARDTSVRSHLRIPNSAIVLIVVAEHRHLPGRFSRSPGWTDRRSVRCGPWRNEG